MLRNPLSRETNGYVREASLIQQVTDKGGCEIQLPQTADWTMVGDGIEGCYRPEVGTALFGRSRHETHRTVFLRIYCRACPVVITFLETSEYADYNDSQYSTSSQWTRRVIFEAS